MSSGIEGERVQKRLANAGLGSRREIEGWIKDGRIKINGELATLGDRLGDQDRVTVDGRPISLKRLAPVARYIILYNKPEGEIVSRNDPGGRPTVFKRLPKLESGRWISVGRLDINSAGLLLLTTDGELANRLMHPRQQVEREYAVRVHGVVTAEMTQHLVNGIELEDGPARFEEIVAAGGERTNQWFHVVIMEGRKREVRRLWEAVGVTVNRLKRVRYGPVLLDSKVKAGQWRELYPEERKAMLGQVGLRSDKAPPALQTAKARRPKPAGARKSPWK